VINTLSDTTADYCIILNENIISFSKENIEHTVSYFQLQDIGAIAYKLIFRSKVISLGMTYQNQKITGCYFSVPCNDAGFYGRALLDQYVPLCSPVAFACRQKEWKHFYQQYTNNHKHATNWQDFIMEFSLHLFSYNKKIAGIAQAELHCKKNPPIYISKEFLQINKEELQQVSKLYCVPPYYKG